MLPGMGGRIDPRRMNQMMKQLGIDVREVDGVEEVVIRTASKTYRFVRPDVTIMRAQGQDTYQVVGRPSVEESGAPPPAAAAPAALPISEDDVKMVAEQTGRSPAEAKKALESTNGDIAEAILKLQG